MREQGIPLLLIAKHTITLTITYNVMVRLAIRHNTTQYNIDNALETHRRVKSNDEYRKRVQKSYM